LRIEQIELSGHPKCSAAPWSVAFVTVRNQVRYRVAFALRVTLALTAARKLFCRERGVLPAKGSAGCVSVCGTV
jgi:hypothetical protein